MVKEVTEVADSVVKRKRAPPTRFAVAVALALSMPVYSLHADHGATLMAALPSDLTELSLDQLLSIEVTSVSKRPEPLSSAAAAVFVLTGDDIRRSGARRIADVLRLVPGLNVAQVDARSYAITARGFNSSSADKLQVLLDGRSAYTPLTSAVFWDVFDAYLPDIERIEVIRGPGATLWGANAVNGVINIVTRSAADTQGTEVSGGVGTEERAFAALRSGTHVGDVGAARVFVKSAHRDAALMADGADGQDGSRSDRAGFRSDWTLSDVDALTVSGSAYASRFNTAPTATVPEPRPTDASGGHVLARWAHGDGASDTWTLQTYYDHYQRDIPSIYGEVRDTLDVDFQHRIALSERQSLMYGLGFRHTRDETEAPPSVAVVFLPEARTLETTSAFIQHQSHFLDDAVVLTLGSKFEHNDFTGFEIQPGARVGWQIGERAFTWAAVSRAVRTPNRLDSDLAIFCPPPDGFPGICGPGLLRIGNPDFRSERLMAYEWGLRLWNENDLTADLATFYNDYSDLRSQEQPGQGSAFGNFANKNEARSHGAELTLGWRPRTDLNLQAWYAYLHIDAKAMAGSTDVTTAGTLEGLSPRHQAALRASWQPSDRWQVDGIVRYVDALPAERIDAYTELDLRLAWRPRPAIEVALAGRNLLDHRHVEFGAEGEQKAIERAAFIEFTWFWP